MLSRRQPEIHGHRGARGLAPENTLSAIRAGIEAGCSGIEIDLWISADNRLVVHHDPVLSPSIARGPDGNWIEAGPAIRSGTVEQLRQFDVGRTNPDSQIMRRHPHQVPCDGSTVPTLGECVETAWALNPDVVLNLEFKNAPHDRSLSPALADYIRIAASEIRELDIAGRIFIQSFDWRIPTGILQHLPDVKIGLISAQQPGGNPVSPVAGKPDLWTGGRDLLDYPDLPSMVAACGAHVWSCDFRDLDREKLETARGLGLEVYVWTVNTEPDMREMIRLGVDAIISDYPDRLVPLIGSGS